MALNFGDIRRRFRWRLEHAYRRALDAQIKIINRSLARYFAEGATASVEYVTTVKDVKMRYRQWLFTFVGQALSAWALMEELIVAIASLLLKTEINKSGVVMYSIINFSVWLTLIDELFPLEPVYMPLKPKWNKISKRLRSLKDIRDRLAHHVISTKDDAELIEDNASLMPSRFDFRQKS